MDVCVCGGGVRVWGCVYGDVTVYVCLCEFDNNMNGKEL